MLALISEIRTPYHRLRAGPKLTVLCGCTVALVWAQGMGTMLLALAGVFVLYLVPGFTFFREGLRLLAPLWVFVAFVVA